MVAQLVILATALIGLEADWPIPYDGIPLMTQDGLLFDIKAPTASIGAGSNGVFSNFGYLQVNGWLFHTASPLKLVRHLNGGRTVVAGPATAPGGLIVTRKVYVPWEAGKNYARFVDVISNDSDQQQYALVQFFGFSGLGWLAEFKPQGDDFIVIAGSLSSTGPLPEFGILHQRGLGFRPERATDVIFYDGGLFSKAYLFVPIKPHGKVTFVHFVVQVLPDHTLAQAGRGTAEIASGGVGAAELGGTADFANADRSDMLALYNFFIDTDVNMDGYVNVLDMILVRNDLGKTPQSARNPRCDANHDARIDVLDLLLVRNDLGWPF